MQDEAHVQLKIVPRTTWSRARNPAMSTGGMWGRKSVTITGAMGGDGEHYFGFYDAGNWENARDFLLRVYERFGPVLIFMDNASYHQKRNLGALARETGGGMQFRFLPKYTPELNPIETQWSGCKDWIHGTPLRDAAHLARGLDGAIRRNIIKIARLHDCYIP